MLRSVLTGLAQAGSTKPGKVAFMHSLINRNARPSALAALMAVALLLASVAPAFAQSSLQGGYADEGGQIQEQVQGGSSDNGSSGSGGGGGETGDTGTTPTNTTTTKSSNEGDQTLPFTGLEVGLMLAAGLALAGLGFGLRRVARPTV